MLFKYIGDDERLFPHAGLTVAPGDVVDRAENPDQRFFEPVPAASARATKTTDNPEG